ncbi:MAG: alpha-1,2-fucosyltransferase [Lachnospiraceae bacterium]|nr:alpha-1,2-fucosyltransferase [Lachnospiraceae bacterium]
MIVIRLQGGLGNQLFQYALYLQLKHTGYDVRIDTVSGFAEDPQRSEALSSLFGVSYDIADDRDIRRLRDSFMDPIHRIRRKLFGRRNLEWVEPDGQYYPEVLSRDEVYYDGYFQSEQYFPEEVVREQLVREFSEEALSVRGFWKSTAADFAAKMDADGECSVSLHIRRGDYLLPQQTITHGGICTEAYYRHALAEMEEAVPGASYYLFGDDKAFCHAFAEQFARGELGIPAGKQMTVVELPEGGGQDASELLLMSHCRNHILANSSFSWWGAWLGNRRAARSSETDGQGVTYAPDRWFNNRRADALYTEDMRRVVLRAED